MRTRALRLEYPIDEWIEEGVLPFECKAVLLLMAAKESDHDLMALLLKHYYKKQSIKGKIMCHFTRKIKILNHFVSQSNDFALTSGEVRNYPLALLQKYNLMRVLLIAIKNIDYTTVDVLLDNYLDIALFNIFGYEEKDRKSLSAYYGQAHSTVDPVMTDLIHEAFLYKHMGDCKKMIKRFIDAGLRPSQVTVSSLFRVENYAPELIAGLVKNSIDGGPFHPQTRELAAEHYIKGNVSIEDVAALFLQKGFIALITKKERLSLTPGKS